MSQHYRGLKVNEFDNICDGNGCSSENNIMMRIDVAKAICSLPERCQIICRHLMLDTPIGEIYREAKISHTTFRHDVRRIRQHFSSLGLNIYIED